MRTIIKKCSSTKAERVFLEILKKNHIPFKYRVILENREIDFIVGNCAVEIDGHIQSSRKNDFLIEKGFTPIHYNNKEVINNREQVEQSIKSKYGLFSSKGS